MPFGDLTVSEGRLVKWYRKLGEPVAAGEHVADIETDKAVVEIESPTSGVLAEILAEEGTVVPWERRSASCRRVADADPAVAFRASRRRARARGARTARRKSSCRTGRSAPGRRCRAESAQTPTASSISAEHHCRWSPGGISAACAASCAPASASTTSTRGLGTARASPSSTCPITARPKSPTTPLALMLALTRGHATYHDAIRSDPAAGWIQTAAPAVRRLRGRGLRRSSVSAASGLRRRCAPAAFGMRIAFYDPYLPSGMEIAVGAQRCATPRRADGGRGRR